MDSWIVLPFLSLSICIALGLILLSSKKEKRSLPPGPPSIPVVGSITWLTESLFELEPTLRRLFSDYGPVVTLHIGPRTAIFVKDGGFAHQALIQNGAVAADRLPSLPHERIFTSNQHTISTAGYGPLWRLLRRNLVTEVLHPSRIKLFADGREWALRILLDKLRSQAETTDGVVVVYESIRHALLGLQLLMCFGLKLDEKAIREIDEFQTFMFSGCKNFTVFAFLPMITKILFRKRWNTILAIRRKQEEIFSPLIRARRGEQKQKIIDGLQSFYSCYVDSLFELQIPEDGGRKLNEDETVSLCAEFLFGGTETPGAALQWIIANLVKRQDIQAKLVEEMEGVIGKDAKDAIKKEDMEKMPYLKAVVLEGLRLHPPSHFVLPHAASKDIMVGRYVVPKNASLNFRPMEMGRDEEVWEEPMEFRPERFMAGGEGEGVDITGSREIKMMPFGAGRRVCPGLGLAMFHIEYFVANLIWKFEWEAVEGEEVDMTEKPELTVVMKNPLRARIFPRRNNRWDFHN